MMDTLKTTESDHNHISKKIQRAENSAQIFTLCITEGNFFTVELSELHVLLATLLGFWKKNFQSLTIDDAFCQQIIE